MEYLPKSKLGAAVAVLYLLPVSYFLVGFVFGGGGPHGDAGSSFIYAFLLTLPLSAAVLSIIDSLKGTQPNKLPDLLFIGSLVVCALINAVFIYLVVGFVRRTWQSSRKRLK